MQRNRKIHKNNIFPNLLTGWVVYSCTETTDWQQKQSLPIIHLPRVLCGLVNLWASSHGGKSGSDVLKQENRTEELRGIGLLWTDDPPFLSHAPLLELLKELRGVNCPIWTAQSGWTITRLSIVLHCFWLTQPSDCSGFPFHRTSFCIGFNYLLSFYISKVVFLIESRLLASPLMLLVFSSEPDFSANIYCMWERNK